MTPIFQILGTITDTIILKLFLRVTEALCLFSIYERTFGTCLSLKTLCACTVQSSIFANATKPARVIRTFI